MYGQVHLYKATISFNESTSAANAKIDDVIASFDDIQVSFTPADNAPCLVKHPNPKLVMRIMPAVTFVCRALVPGLGQCHSLVL